MKLKDVWLLGRQVMTNLDSILKSRDRDNKSLYSQSYGFSNSHVWIWELDYKEGWAPKNWCFWTVVLEKTLESPLDCKEISPKYSLEGLMLKLKLQYFGHLIRRMDSLEKTLMLEKVEGKREGDIRGWDGWMASSAWCAWVWASSRSWWWTGKPGMLQSMGLQRVVYDWATELKFLIHLSRALQKFQERIFH